jgi:hypothetical protein
MSHMPFYSISKNEIIHKKFEEIDKIIKTLELRGRDAYKTVTLGISGFADVPDELYEIQKVRGWVQHVIRKHPNFFYFLDFDTDSHIHLLGCLGDIESIYEGEILTVIEMMERGLTQNDLPPKIHKCRFTAEYAKLLTEGIKQYCEEIGDMNGKMELLNHLKL